MGIGQANRVHTHYRSFDPDLISPILFAKLNGRCFMICIDSDNQASYQESKLLFSFFFSPLSFNYSHWELTSRLVKSEEYDSLSYRLILVRSAWLWCFFLGLWFFLVWLFACLTPSLFHLTREINGKIVTYKYTFFIWRVLQILHTKTIRSFKYSCNFFLVEIQREILLI